MHRCSGVRRSNGRDRAYASQRRDQGIRAMAATEDASHRPEQGAGRTSIATPRQRINRDGESSEDYVQQVDATAATEDASHGPDYTSLGLKGCDSSCIATDSRADYARM